MNQSLLWKTATFPDRFLTLITLYISKLLFNSSFSGNFSLLDKKAIGINFYKTPQMVP
jgi:hypothetical protein